VLSTHTKLTLARAAFHLVVYVRRLSGRDYYARVTRAGILWDLDLREGIDFAIFLLAIYDRSTVRAFREFVREGDVVFDIGANVGAHTLHLSAIVGAGGQVFAFEPTDYAFMKLRRNMGLNPHLADRISTHQILLGDGSASIPEDGIYASWPLVDSPDKHPRHGGRKLAIEGARAMQLDAFFGEHGIDRIDILKMDVDGNECQVLRGAVRTLRTFRPQMILELAPYNMGIGRDSLEEFLALLKDTGYTLKDLRGAETLPAEASQIRRMIPDGAGINVLAVPD
jgi:FkbM family methyltransferase